MQQSSSSSVRVFYPRWTRDELIELLRSRFWELALKFSVKKAVLFGSWAKGNFTAASDIDLLVICPGPVGDEAFRSIRKSLHIPRLELHLYSEEDYSGARTTVDKMIQHGIVVYP